MDQSGLAIAFPEGFTLRHPTEADLPAIQRLVDECDSADAGEPRRSDFDVAAEAADPGEDFYHNWWVLADEAGTLAAATGVYWPPTCEGRLRLWTHPAYRGRGLSQRLNEVVEGRARELAAAALAARAPAPHAPAPALHHFCDDAKPHLQAWLLERRYRRVHELFAMRIDLSAGVPAAPEWPPGFTIRDMRRGVDDEAVWAAEEESFAGSLLHVPIPLDEWQTYIFAHEDFDAGLWVLCWDDAQLAGHVAAFPLGNAAYISGVVVRDPWRGRGLARAMLLAEFARLHERGMNDVFLYVDAANATGAVRLYEAAGMRVWQRKGVFRLEL